MAFPLGKKRQNLRSSNGEKSKTHTSQKIPCIMFFFSKYVLIVYRIHSGEYFLACLNPPKAVQVQMSDNNPTGLYCFWKFWLSQTFAFSNPQNSTCAVSPKPPEGTDLLPCEIKYKAIKYIRTMGKFYHKTNFLIIPESPIHMCHGTW